ncbi:hypothetical protein A3C96_00575 [Candidatus Uhrbacteria bacterium RIFCSPHIGHO2_02_FULL_60_10]|uniref:Uncharacterized protein n=1 Tax=Candidatus Uhrbacteria bacterium RIFCSPHIGHO2_02_FULL_60_10 TaxID=1802392 RepID=A0A1F7U9Y3_9BACT|nr:MAG: hypothetical protein A3C96_00575 [Candidatus Uhrbacteria bacterium RIFCSPHIGHO2_02_FULL_60_10]
MAKGILIAKKTIGRKRSSKLRGSAQRSVSGTHALSARREDINLHEKTRIEAAAKKVSHTAQVGNRTAGVGGELLIVGLRPEDKIEVLGLLHNLAAQAEVRDPSDRLLKTEERADGLVIFVTQSHLAVSLGKHLARARKGGQLDIDWPKGDEMARVRWVAP